MTLKNRRLGFPVGLPVASVVLGSALLSACTTSPEIAATTESKAVTVASNNATQGAVFASPVQLMADGAPIATASPGYAAPAWQDVTGDGRADLVVGQFKDGLMGVFAQNADGSFAAGQWLQADGKDAVVPGIWWCTSATPQFVDLNKDGYLDILSGSYSRKEADMAGEFHVLYGKKDGTFKTSVILQNIDGEPLEIETANADPENQMASIVNAICTRPYAADLNADGHLDIVSGNASGSFAIFWADESGKFSNSTELLHDTDNNKLVVAGGHSDPSFVDWDRDGDLDMLSGAGEGGAYLFENVGDKTSPQFAKAVELVAPAPGGNVELYGAHIKGPQGSTRVIAEDINQDGKLDLLIGDSVTIWMPKDGESEADCNNKLSAWNAEWAELDQSDEDKKSRDFMMKQGQLTMKLYDMFERNATGHVWLYVRK